MVSPALNCGNSFLTINWSCTNFTIDSIILNVKVNQKQHSRFSSAVEFEFAKVKIFFTFENSIFKIKTFFKEN